MIGETTVAEISMHRLVLFAPFLLTAAAVAQSTSSLDVGQLVRVTSGSDRFIGEVLETSVDTLLLTQLDRPGMPPIQVGLDDTSIIEIRELRDAGSTAVTGGVVGLLTGTAITGAFYASTQDRFARTIVFHVGLRVVILPLTVIGALIGAGGKFKKWAPVQARTGLSFDLSARGSLGGFAVAMTVDL